MTLLKNLVGVLGLLWLLSQWFPSKPSSVPVSVAAKPYFTEVDCVDLKRRLAANVAKVKRTHTPEYAAEYEAHLVQYMRSQGYCVAR